MLEDCRESALQIPGREEERPIDIRDEIAKRHVLEPADPELPGDHDAVGSPCDFDTTRSRLRQGKERCGLLATK